MKIKRLVLLLLLVPICCIGAQKSAGVRQPSVAGQFYPSDPAQLKLAIQQFLEDAPTIKADPAIAIVVPHAGYLYSGQIAADAYRQVKGYVYDTIVILGTNHVSENLSGISLYASGAYKTPLGEVPVDVSIADALLKENPDCRADSSAQQREHSIEVQVPFIQVLFPSAKIVPAMIGSADPAMCARFGSALGKVLKGKRALIVASSDLSHYPGHEDATAVDRQTLEAMVRLDAAQFASQTASTISRNVSHLSTCACGQGPILAAMAAAKALGATRGIVVSYANSGDVVAEDRSRVVGYGSVVFAPGEGGPDTKALASPPGPLPSGPLRVEDRKALLKFARQSLQRFLTTETVPLARNLSARLQYPQGVFVTLKNHGELRGCIGHLTGDFPVGLTTGWMAVQAGENDPRFSPVSAKELAGLEIEISVMTPLKPIAKATDIVLGRDGVVIQKAGRSAVFLPQVAPEQGWNLNEMLDNLCLKAGLPRDAWKSGAQFLVFQADVFSESEYR
jgi:AmmeMemoRadiSam system protein B/AmmeMemoRadiSam system protein A